MAHEPDSPRPSTTTLSVTLKLSDVPVAAEITVPTEPLELRAMLPVFRSLAETIIGRAVEAETAQGRSISCRSGCGACCRQLVPISEVEAGLLADLVAGFSEPRRSTIRARFAEAGRRLEEAGLAERLRHPETLTGDAIRPFGLRYFEQGIPCPFLEDESCSIYEDRPVACREYLVTSPAEHCARPSAETIQCVNLAARVSTAIARLSAGPNALPGAWVPLILALEWAEHHPGLPPPRSGPEWLRAFFQALTGRELPPPPAPGASPGPGRSDPDPGQRAGPPGQSLRPDSSLPPS